METITQEDLAKTFIKSILQELYTEYEQDLFAHELCVDFDSYVFVRMEELGRTVYGKICEIYGDLDGVIVEEDM